MSLTNPNKVITEERLSEFYTNILPYLGGMPDILANKFDKSNLYSTDEKIIGQWIDGKPLYQKIFTGQNINFTWESSNKHAIATISPLIANVENIIKCFGGNNTTHDKCMDISWYYDNGDWQLQSILDGTIDYIGFIYTKDTDLPVNIGIDTDYSTTEKIIGTWIDGRPIYQKTITNQSIVFSWVSSNKHALATINPLISNVDLFISMKGYIPTINVMIDISAYVDSNKWKLASILGDTITTLTIQYIKTTN